LTQFQFFGIFEAILNSNIEGWGHIFWASYLFFNYIQVLYDVITFLKKKESIFMVDTHRVYPTNILTFLLL